MNDYQVVEVAMMEESVSLFDNNPDLEKANPVLKGHIDLVRPNLIEIEKNKMIQEFVNTGYTETKKDAKLILANLDVNITSSICSFADDSGKKELYNEFKTPISKVEIMKDADIVSYSNTIFMTSTKYKTELKPYNVTDEEIANLKILTEEYSKILLVPGQERDQRNIATSNIKELIPETLQIFTRKIDRDMIHYKDTEPEIYKKYEKAREIDDSQTTAMSIRGKVTGGEAELEVLDYVQVTVKTNNSEFVTNTSSKGNYQFKGIPDGKCRVIFKKNYYDTLVINSEVHGDKATTIDAKMTKSN
jgi:hypothetical protein